MAFLAGGLMVAAACAPAHKRTTPPIRVGAPLISKSRISLPPAEADGLAQLREWPKACDLLTPADMKAVLPQITKIVESPRAQKMKIMYLDDEDGDYDAPGTSCEIQFWVAGTERARHARPDILHVDDIAVGDTDTVKDNYDSVARPRSRAPGGLGAVECAADEDGYYCRMPNIAFAVSAEASLYIAGFAGQPKHIEARTYWVRNVLPAFVRSVSSKLPAE